MLEKDIQIESDIILRTKAVKYIDVLDTFKEDLFKTIKLKNCLDEQLKCLQKVNIYQEGSKILKEIFKIEKE